MPYVLAWFCKPLKAVMVTQTTPAHAKVVLRTVTPQTANGQHWENACPKCCARVVLHNRPIIPSLQLCTGLQNDVVLAGGRRISLRALRGSLVCVLPLSRGGQITGCTL